MIREKKDSKPKPTTEEEQRRARFREQWNNNSKKSQYRLAEESLKMHRRKVPRSK